MITFPIPKLTPRACKSLFWLFLISQIFVGGGIFGEEEGSSIFPFFQDRYVYLGLGISYPEQESSLDFEASDGDFYLGYQYVYDDKWMVGVRFGYTTLVKRLDRNEFYFLRVSQESLRLVRIYYPLFLAFGGGLIYIEPSQAKVLPPKKQHVYKRETGISLIASLVYIVNKRVLLSLRVEKWRGLDSDDYASIEPTLQLHYSLP